MKLAGRVVLALGVVAGLGGCRDQQQQQQEQQQQQTQQPEDQPTKTRTFEKVRGPAVAGLFYPAHQKDLTEQVDGFLAEVEPESIENVRGLVCPHAGYGFSGKTAAFGYKLLAARDDVRTVIILAPSHTAAFQGASIPDVDAYETPLGMIPVSPKATELAKVEPFVVNPRCEHVIRPQWWHLAPKELPPFGEETPHTWEHSLEVQLPFLQRTLKDFSLMPIVFSRPVDPQVAARALQKFIDEKTILVASSDLSHLHPYQCEMGKRLDSTCIEAICSLKIACMERQEACGKLPILTLMHIARQRGWKAKLLNYDNCGDVPGNVSKAVGYAAIAFYDPGGAAEDQTVPAQTQPHRFTPKQRKFLLELARKTVDRVVKGGTLPQPNAADLAGEFTEPKGCFVTLTLKKNDQLRGCIGSIFPEEPLYQAVIHKARDAALRDRRFSPVKPEELEQIEVEVSVLTVPKLLEFSSPGELLEKLRPHVDGVVLRAVLHAGRSVVVTQATYLPQVWEGLPEKERFLSQLAHKAGLPLDAWKWPITTILVYQVEAFKESEM